jgi:hypothetical protein
MPSKIISHNMKLHLPVRRFALPDSLPFSFSSTQNSSYAKFSCTRSEDVTHKWLLCGEVVHIWNVCCLTKEMALRSGCNMWGAVNRLDHLFNLSPLSLRRRAHYWGMCVCDGSGDYLSHLAYI